MGEYAPGKSAGAPQGLPETFSEDEGARNSSNPGYSGYSKDLRYTDTNSKACLQHAKTLGHVRKSMWWGFLHKQQGTGELNPSMDGRH